MSSKFSTIRLLLHGFENLGHLVVNGQKLGPSKEEYRFVAPISKFDPLGATKGEDLKITALQFIEFEHTHDEVKITW